MTRALTPDEEKTLLDTVRKYKATEKAIVLLRLPLETGLRLQEVRGLNWIDLLDQEEHILKSFQLRKEIAKFHKPRQVFLNRHIRAELEAYRRYYTKHLDPQPGEPLLLSRHGLRLSCRQIQRIADFWFRMSGITGVTYHGLRHTFSLKAQAHGKNIEATRRLLGHERLETTRIYLRSMDTSTLEQAVDW